MSKYLLVYYGGNMGTSPDEVNKSMTEWNNWFKSMGKNLVDTGAPTMPGKMVTSRGVKSAMDGEMVSGYTVISAGDMNEAVKIAKGAPGMDEGLKVAVYPMAEMPVPKTARAAK